MKKILITGAGGFLGWNLCKIAKEKFTCVGFYHSKFESIENVKMIQCDLTDFSAMHNHFQEIHPDAVIHTAAVSDPNYCQKHTTESELANIGVSVELAILCKKNNIPFVFTSTDLVFDGTTPPYFENSPVHPLSEYGKQKALAEKEILLNYKDATICRMPLMFGDSPSHSKRFLQLWIDQLKSGKKLTLFNDEYRTPVSARDASKGLLLVCGNEHGIIHLGGKERISRYDMGKQIVQLLDINDDMIISCKQNDIKMAAPRPKDVSLNSEKAFKSGYNPGSVFSELKNLELFKRKV